MSTRNDFFFGWDLLYKTIESIVNKKSDIIIALAHFVLIKHSNFGCIGVGEDKTFTEDEVGTELLPDGWNDEENKYALRYIHGGNLYLLLGQNSGDCLIINLLDVKTTKVSNIALEPEKLVKATKGSLTTMIPNVSEITNRYRKELIEPVFSGNTQENTTQTATSTTTQNPLRGERVPLTNPLAIGPLRRGGSELPPFGFPDVGRGDLDPLGRAGPGNLFEFPPRPNFQGGAVPRFDPFGPPERSIRPNPNPDHLQPPNFGGDNYYM